MSVSCAESSSRTGETTSGDDRTLACGKVRNSGLPALRALRGCGTLQTHAGVDRHATAFEREHRIEVELGNLGHVLGQPCEPVDEIEQRSGVGRWRAAEAAHETTGLAPEDEPPRVYVGERRDAKARVPDELREHAAGPERHERPEDRVLHDPRE